LDFLDFFFGYVDEDDDGVDECDDEECRKEDEEREN